MLAGGVDGGGTPQKRARYAPVSRPPSRETCALRLPTNRPGPSTACVCPALRVSCPLLPVRGRIGRACASEGDSGVRVGGVSSRLGPRISEFCERDENRASGLPRDELSLLHHPDPTPRWLWWEWGLLMVVLNSSGLTSPSAFCLRACLPLHRPLLGLRSRVPDLSSSWTAELLRRGGVSKREDRARAGDEGELGLSRRLALASPLASRPSPFAVACESDEMSARLSRPQPRISRPRVLGELTSGSLVERASYPLVSRPLRMRKLCERASFGVARHVPSTTSLMTDALSPTCPLSRASPSVLHSFPSPAVALLFACLS